MSLLERRFSTGLQFLDRRLSGGLLVGSLLAVTAPAGSQSEILLYHLASTRPTLYVSTTNPSEAEFRSAVEKTALPTHGEIGFTHLTAGEILAEPEAFLSRIQPESLVVIDPIDGLERREDDQYSQFINGLKRRLRETDSVGVFYALDTDPVPDGRRVTLKRADYVWQIEQLVLSRDIKTRLLVTKARRDRALDEPIPLVISDRVQVDTSRRIG